MLKMYRAEVLGKLPVIQHFLFGSLLPYEGPSLPENETPDEDDAHWGHTHTKQKSSGPWEPGWGDCCGIPVPSVFGAGVTSSSNAPSQTMMPNPSLFVTAISSPSSNASTTTPTPIPNPTERGRAGAAERGSFKEMRELKGMAEPSSIGANTEELEEKVKNLRLNTTGVGRRKLCGPGIRAVPFD